MATSLKSPLCLYGGKTRLSPKLLPLVPKHKTYVEVFGGSAALILRKECVPAGSDQRPELRARELLSGLA